MIYTKRKIHSGFVGMLLLLAGAALFFLYAHPIQQKQYELRISISRLEQELRPIAEKNPELISAGTLSEVEQKDLSRAIPETVEQDTILLDLNRMIKTADVTLNTLQFSLQKGELPTVVISANLQGSSANMNRFLKLLEGNPRKLVVKEAGVSKTVVSQTLDSVNVTLTIEAFYRKEQ